MNRPGQWIACCAALSLFLQATTGFALPDSTTPEAGGIMPCHAEADLERLHDKACSYGCESTPTRDTGTPAWGMPLRLSGDDQPEPIALPMAWFRAWAPEPQAPRQLDARAPPPRQALTPVSRRDILLD